MVSFGDPRKAEIVTVGSNPGPSAFLGATGKLDAQGEHRLSTHNSFGISFRGLRVTARFPDDQLVENCSKAHNRPFLCPGSKAWHFRTADQRTL